jgi:hypothetical protein
MMPDANNVKFACWMVSIAEKPVMPQVAIGVVHDCVVQKLLKSNKIKSLIDDQNTGSRHCSNEYKCNRITTLAYDIMSGRPPPIQYILTLVKPFCFD